MNERNVAALSEILCDDGHYAGFDYVVTVNERHVCREHWEQAQDLAARGVLVPSALSEAEAVFLTGQYAAIGDMPGIIQRALAERLERLAKGEP